MRRPPSPLGEIIRRQRELHRLTLRQFAAMAGISNPYLSQIERGLRAPSKQVVEAIARSLETSVDDLYEQAGIPLDGQPHGAEGRRRLEEVLAADAALSARQRRLLVDLYDALVSQGSAAASPPPSRLPRDS